MALPQTIPDSLTPRALTEYEESCRINFVELEAQFESNVGEATTAMVADVKAMEQSIVNQVRRHKIISGKKLSALKKVTVRDVKLRAHLFNAFGYMYFYGKHTARRDIENSLGHRIKVRGVSVYKEIVELVPSEALADFGRRQLVSKAEFGKMAARERARAFTVAGVVEKDMLNSTRMLVSRAVDEGWSLDEFSRGLREANVKYTGTVFGTEAKKGLPLTPYHTETILRTNFSEVYNRGRWNMMNDPDVIQFVPAYQYSGILDNRIRPTHEEMDGRIYLRDDPIWDTWYPPNGFSCRCTVIPVTSNKSFTVSRPAPATLTPDTGFGLAA